MTTIDTDYYHPYLHQDVEHDYSHRSHTQLISDVNVAHDFLKRLVREKDSLRLRLLVQARELTRERRWRRWLTAALGFTWVSFVAIMKYMVPYVVAGIVHGAR